MRKWSSLWYSVEFMVGLNVSSVYYVWIFEIYFIINALGRIFNSSLK